jgi:hypothetical protein
MSPEGRLHKLSPRNLTNQTPNFSSSIMDLASVTATGLGVTGWYEHLETRITTHTASPTGSPTAPPKALGYEHHRFLLTMETVEGPWKPRGL